MYWNLSTSHILMLICHFEVWFKKQELRGLEYARSLTENTNKRSRRTLPRGPAGSAMYLRNMASLNNTPQLPFFKYHVINLKKQGWKTELAFEISCKYFTCVEFPFIYCWFHFKILPRCFWLQNYILQWIITYLKWKEKECKPNYSMVIFRLLKNLKNQSNNSFEGKKKKNRCLKN